MADLYKRNPPTRLVTGSANGNASEPKFNGSTELNGSIISNHLDQTEQLRLIGFQFSLHKIYFLTDEKQCEFVLHKVEKFKICKVQDIIKMTV